MTEKERCKLIKYGINPQDLSGDIYNDLTECENAEKNIKAMSKLLKNTVIKKAYKIGQIDKEETNIKKMLKNEFLGKFDKPIEFTILKGTKKAWLFTMFVEIDDDFFHSINNINRNSYSVGLNGLEYEKWIKNNKSLSKTFEHRWKVSMTSMAKIIADSINCQLEWEKQQKDINNNVNNYLSDDDFDYNYDEI